MSTYEIEEAVEGAIRVLHHSPRALDRRSLYWNLYAFEQTFDLGFTRLRVLDLLVADRFTHRLPLEAHPDFERCEGVLGVVEGFELINTDPSAPWDALDNPVACYICEGAVCFDTGSPLWERMVEAGSLAGKDAAPVQKMSVLEVAAVVCEEAEAAGELSLIADWHGMVEGELHAGVESIVGPQGLVEVQALPAAQRIRAVALRSGALEDLDFGGERPPREVIEASASLAWWYGLG